ncbi:MAG: MBL fold metallo-hydrolase [Firmicutes bacterium]|nr:MBL fold metallo-hydrolase [Bacillota bacterium]
MSLADIEYLLVTHAHEDHFCPWYLRWRYFPKDRVLPPKGDEMGPLFSRPKLLHLYGNEVVLRDARRWVGDDPRAHLLELHRALPGQRVDLDTFSFVPVLANHDPSQECLNYIIMVGGKTILYATDTAWFLPETMEIIHDFRYDLVVMDGTFGFNNSYDATAPGHSNFHINEEALRLFQAHSLLKDGGQFVITHTGPHHAPPYDICAPLLKKKGLVLAYDGMQIELQGR